MEFGLINSPVQIEDHAQVLDTLELARDLHPGQRNSLDALCKRYDVDNSSRNLHGALLDSEILAEVYLAMTGGQSDLALGFEAPDIQTPGAGDFEIRERPSLLILRPTDDELAAHESRLKAIKKKSGHCQWLEP